jgi:thiosulfate reductase cytochrome b subunit
VLQTFDQDGDGNLSENELKIDSPEKQALIARRLEALGLRNPRILGQIQPYSINHNVARGEWAIHDCQTCHSRDSRLTQPIQLAAYVPAGVMPDFVSDANVIPGGKMVMKDGALYYQPLTTEQNLYIFGRDRVHWVDTLGALFFVAVLFSVAGHGGMRFFVALRRPKASPEIRRVYMYQAYERFWHWLQTVVIVLLLFTGLIIHRPDLFGILSFRGVVVVHNVLAAILALNAALSLFYHLASGEIRQFIPRPYGFFDQAILQARYYLQGIFRGAPHPFEKNPHRKLNPLQQVTYFAILNILLPVQGVSGVLMWGAQKWPRLAELLGGLPFLAPLHTLTAWLFAAFIVGHVYLTTTGHEPLASIRAMVTGWDEVETSTESEYEPLEEQE